MLVASLADTKGDFEAALMDYRLVDLWASYLVELLVGLKASSKVEMMVFVTGKQGGEGNKIVCLNLQNNDQKHPQFINLIEYHFGYRYNIW